VEDTSGIAQEYQEVIIELVAVLARKPSTVYDAKLGSVEQQKRKYTQALEDFQQVRT
jgi:hypothetical protein